MSPSKLLFTAKWFTPQILVLRFVRQRDMCESMLRFAEAAENPGFRGKVFTHSEFEKAHKKQHGKFNYHTMWAGFNQPSVSLKPFLAGKYDPLTPREQAVLAPVREKTGQYCVVAYKKGDAGTLVHELAHALYAVDSQYKKDVQALLKTVPLQDLIHSQLKGLGYDRRVFEDETHAYLVGGNIGHMLDLDQFLNKKTLAELNKHSTRFYKNFQKHAKRIGVSNVS